MKKIITAPWAFTKWCGRIALWVFLLPVGIWRSLHHSNAKQFSRIEKAMERRP